jgi:sugar lactone lactonase YvrE
MSRTWILVLGVLVAAAGCGDDETANGGGTGGNGGVGGSPARACATDIEVGEVQAFGEESPSTTEGITFDLDDSLYVSARYLDAGTDDELLDVSLTGSFETAAASESILGLAAHEDGIIAASVGTGEVLLIDPSTGGVDIIADGNAAGMEDPNFVVTTPWGTMLVSDDRVGEDTIYEVTWEGDVSAWVTGVPTPNGMVFSLDNGTLYVATTFEEAGLWRVPVNAMGEAGTPTKWVAFETKAPDGVAIDSEGNVYVALNTAGEIAKVDPEGNDTIVASGVRGAASLAFGQGDFDPCSVYVTSLFDTQLRRVGIGVLGVEK